MQYWIYLDRRTEIEDKKDELELQTYNLNPERWELLYRPSPGVFDPEQLLSGEEMLPVTDPADLNDFFAGLDRKRVMTGAQAANVLGFAEGAGRRV